MSQPTARASGLWWGFLGVLAFSFTVPLTRVAVAGMSPLFVGSARAVIAATLAVAVLAITRQALPNRNQFGRLLVVGAGVVVGFPLFITFALQYVEASHAAVVIGLLPAATAVAAVLRTGERPSVRFWVFATVGAAAAVGFASASQGGFGQLEWADLLLFGAVIVTAIGYSEGALVSREIGSWQTISWALVIWSPFMLTLAIVALATETPNGNFAEWSAFAYLALVSNFLSFFVWYRGLAIGPISIVSQVQLVQPVLSIIWAALLLGEAISLEVFFGGAVVILCAALAIRSRAG